MRTWRWNADERNCGDEPGPWTDEPDKAQWVDPESGLDCLIVRGPWGALCGYVGVPPEHPYHGTLFPNADLVAHGAVNYSAGCDEDADPTKAICHVPEPGRPEDIWWFGFDCNHAFDYAPGMVIAVNYGTYRTFDYVQRECAGLAAQLAEVG